MSEQSDRPSTQEQVEDFEEEATAAKRSHGEADEFVEDTDVDRGQPAGSESGSSHR